MTKKSKKNKSAFWVAAIGIFFILSLLGGVIGGLIYFMPSFTVDSYFKYVERGEPDEYAIIYGDTPIDEEYYAVKFEDDILLDTSFLIDYEIDKNIFWDEAERVLTITMPVKVIRLKPDEAFYTLNGNQTHFDNKNTALYVRDEKTFIPVSFLNSFYQIDCRRADSAKILIVDNLLEKRKVCEAEGRNSAVRHSPDIKSDIAEKVKKGDELTVYGSNNDFYKVRTSNGAIGYIREKEVREVREIPAAVKEGDTAPLIERFRNRPLNIVWDQIAGEGTTNWVNEKNPHINVTSPTWLSLANGEGDITDKGASSYVNKAKKSGYEVWPLFDNSFNADFTHDSLKSTEKRQYIINQLIDIAVKYGVTGINIDFESYRIEDGYYYTQFLCELGVYFRANGLVSSVDLTVPTMENSPTDRARIGEYIDYVMVMAYDQHWASSQIAGPVAGYDWVDAGILRTLDYIPKEKVLLGLPLYTRIWYEPKGGGSISTRDFSMQRAYDLFTLRNAEMEWEEAAKYYRGRYEYNVDGVPNIITAWLETTESLRHKAEIVNKYQLAGTACWKKGLESEGVWNMLAEVVR